MSKRILIVDDSPLMRKMMVLLFKGAGYDIVGQAKNGQQAIELYQQLQPDIVTMDVVMSGMDGFTAAKEIFRINNQAKILFLSNLDEHKYQDEIQALGGIGFAHKQQTKEILDIIHRHCSN